MGTGMPDDLVESVARGIDLFDCVLPTRNARNGQLFTRRGPISIKNARYAEDQRPPDPECGCPTCRRHSRAYLRHLFVAGEMAAATLNTLHNLHFYLDTMRRIRKAIEFGTFEEFRREFLEHLFPPASAEFDRRVLMPDMIAMPFVLAMAQPGPSSPSIWVQLFPFALMLGIFYLLVLMPMRKRQKKVQEFQAALKVGRRVITTSGIYGAGHAASTTTSVQIADRRQGAHRVARASVGGYQGQEPVVQPDGAGGL